jgi:hypothetical protein
MPAQPLNQETRDWTDHRGLAVGAALAVPQEMETFGPQPRPQEALLSNIELNFRKTFHPLGYSVEIVTNDPAVLIAADESFGHNRFIRGHSALQIRIGVTQTARTGLLPEPTRRQFNHLYLLAADTQNQALIDLKAGANFTWLTSAAVDNRLYLRTNFLEKVVYLLLGATVVTDIHAACVSNEGRGVLLCGDSGAGKSTLAYACARSGWTYTSDDTSYLINNSIEPRVIGHSHRVRFRQSAKALFPELKHFALTLRLEGKPSIEVPIRELPVPRRTSEAAIHAVVFLNRQENVRPECERLPDGCATQRIGADLFSAGEIRAQHVKMLEKLAVLPAYELRYQDFNNGMRLLERLTVGL